MFPKIEFSENRPHFGGFQREPEFVSKNELTTPNILGDTSVRKKSGKKGFFSPKIEPPGHGAFKNRLITSEFHHLGLPGIC